MRLCPACGRPLASGWSCSACRWEAELHGDVPLLAPESAASEEGFDRGAFARLARVEGESFWFRARNRLIVPQHRWLWSAADEHGHHQRRYVRKELLAKVCRAGLEPLRATSFVSLLLPAMAISRRRRRGQVGSFEFRCSPRLNAWLERVLGLELALIRLGVSFPAGGTLMVAARRP